MSRQRSLDLRLGWAAEQGNLAEARAMLRKGACARAADWRGRTGLARAAAAGRDSCVELLAEISDTEALDELGRTALGSAADRGHIGCVEILLRHCDPNGAALDRSHPLMLAIKGGGPQHARCAMLIIAHPATRFDNGERSALAAAAEEGCEELAAALLPRSDPSARSGWRSMTPLMFAAWHGSLRVAELLAPASDLLARDRDGSTALDIARARGHADVAAMLASLAEAAELAGGQGLRPPASGRRPSL